MRRLTFVATFAAAALLSSVALADTFSTSALNPSPVPADGVITGGYPAGGAETTYYFAADLKAGELATQISLKGRDGRDKSLEIALIDPAGKRADSYYIMGSVGANQEQARVLPIDTSGRHIIRVTTKGPETTTFRVELGGSALATAPQTATADGTFSKSFLAPTPVPADGLIAGKFPPSEDAVTTHYYFAANLKAGKLMSQLSFAGRKVTNWTVDKMVEFTLLNSSGRAVGSYYIMSSIEANQEATKAIPIDSSGAYVLRVSVRGPETTSFRLELGGDAIAAR
jgi:hypothetical protein